MNAEMLSLDNVQWRNLKHAYGSAEDIPDLLLQLKSIPSSSNNAEPWFSLWSALAHQGDVYPASFAAVPHIIKALASAPEKADFTYFQFPAWVEICRHKNKTSIPENLLPAYQAALSYLPELAIKASIKPTDNDLLACALAAIAASKGHHLMAEAILELTPETAQQLLVSIFE